MRARVSEVNDLRDRDSGERERTRQLLDEFLSDATLDVDSMRTSLAALEAGDGATWTRVQTLAHNLGARAHALNLRVLIACSRELELLTEDRLAGAPIDGFFMQCVASAIETLELEIASLTRA